jgi:hypothetical protein
LAGSANHSIPIYLCYDLRAIQSFIFRVPKLKYIVGGSALVDRFDRARVPEIAKSCGAELIFAAGGKGTALCRDTSVADALQQALRDEAGRFALDIRFGRAEEFSAAAHAADELHPFIPELCAGHPCEMSGLYPVADGARDGIHESIRRRIFDRKEAIHRHFEARLVAETPDFGPGLLGRGFRFLGNIEPNEPEGRAGRRALGRDRWAVICMDGNDMGRQFREASKRPGVDLPAWIRAMSGALDRCAVAAATSGIERVVRLWSKDHGNDGIDACEFEGEVVLPIRPLVVGGDDIILVCHAAYAFEFAKSASRAWRKQAELEASRHGRTAGLELWPATGNSLSISAGILFASASLPIHVAVPYAEMLLASAKHEGRARAAEHKGPEQPSPAMIDWESVVESVLDTPAARRQRELVFLDGDLGNNGRHPQIELTWRPYELAEFEGLEQDALEHLQPLPNSIRQEILPALRQGAHDRTLFRLRVAKNQPKLASMLEEKPGDFWEVDAERRSTWIPDALAILDERARNAQEPNDA